MRRTIQWKRNISTSLESIVRCRKSFEKSNEFSVYPMKVAYRDGASINFGSIYARVRGAYIYYLGWLNTVGTRAATPTLLKLGEAAHQDTARLKMTPGDSRTTSLAPNVYFDTFFFGIFTLVAIYTKRLKTRQLLFYIHICLIDICNYLLWRYTALVSINEPEIYSWAKKQSIYRAIACSISAVKRMENSARITSPRKASFWKSVF